MHGHRWRVSLVLPAFNEAAGLGQAIAEADMALAGLAQEYEILVVDDGSRDNTAAVALAEAAGRPNVRLLRHDTNRGYGAALRTGFEAARFERVAFTDADCQFHLDDLRSLLEATERHALAVGYRADRKDHWRRRVLSGGYNLLTRALLGTKVRDCDCALKVFRQEALQRLLPEAHNFFVNAEMLARARLLGLEVAEVAVRHRPRLQGRSTVSLLEVPRTLATLLPFWWAKLLFPSTGEARQVKGAQRAYGSGLVLALLVFVAGLLFFVRLRAPLLEPQEARYAEIPRQMLESGQWLVPMLHGEPYLDKPPLFYWSVMASYRVFGVSDWAARLVPGLAGLLTVLATYWWGRRVAGPKAGLAGALLLCLSAEFIYRQRMVGMDGLLALWVTAALGAAHVAMQGPSLRIGWWLLAWLATGLGLLTKGPVALTLFVAPIFVWQFLDPRTARIKARWWAAGLAIALAVAAPWYAAVGLVAPGYAGFFLWKHNVVRFVAPFDHAKPMWYYLPGLVVGLMPWTLLIPSFGHYLLRRSARTAARRPAALGFFLLASAWTLLFFSLAGCKRPSYILPALPPMALALGCYIASKAPGRGWAALTHRASRPASGMAGLALVLAVGMAGLAVNQGLLRPSAGFLLAGAALAGLAALAWRKVSWAVAGAMVFTALLLGVFHLLPAYNRQYALRGHLRHTAERVKGKQLPVACYPQRWDSISFYLPKASVRTYGPAERKELIDDLRTRPQTLLLVKSGAALKEVLADLPLGVEFIHREQRGPVTVGLVRRRVEAPAGALAWR
jgi:dolichol-phosphate mannosyltransferase